MADEPITPAKTAEYCESRGTATPIGSVTIETALGTVIASDAPGYSTLVAEAPDPADSRVLMLLYDAPSAAGEMGHGLISQMTATEARTIAASLLRLATRIDTGKAH